MSVLVDNKVSDITAPTVAISAPAAYSTLNGTVTVTANASDNVGVTKIEFYVNGVLKATDKVSPYSYSWDTTAAGNGSYNLTAKAYDAAGKANISSAVVVTVNNVSTQPIITGDINNDGIVDMSDALLAL